MKRPEVPHRNRRRSAGATQGGRPPIAAGADTLAAAARALAAVRAGQSADEALAFSGAAPDARAVRAVTLGAIRWYLRLAPAIERLASRPAEALPPLLRALLATAAHQIEYSRNPPESTVHRAVDAARVLDLGHAAGFVNAILRRYVREREALLAEGDRHLATRTAHPDWLVDSLLAAWPAEAVAVLEANNQHPPMTLRVDLSRVTRADYLAELSAAGLAARTVDWCPTAVVLERPLPVSAIPGFHAGRVSVQDAAAQLAAPLLGVGAGMRVLDACAAPGGKTGHLLELDRGLQELVAADLDATRLARVRENLSRLGRDARCVALDLRDPQAFAALGTFDRILLDAPCSSTGVIRRHPDIKLLRRATDIAQLARAQAELLAAAFARLRPGGRVLYATCSVLPAEGAEVVAAFLSSQPAARAVGLPCEVALPPHVIVQPNGIQILPDAAAATDGFHYACIERATFSTAA